ncbi:MAG: flagellar basal body-associated FliL family protein [Candidatus Poribacteria bacterium]|nr:flagellar basal body-associated FliL family protein [Candidatus Poribacteria bacterium]
MNENREEAQQGVRKLPIFAYIVILLAIAPFVYLVVVPWAVEKRLDRTQRKMLELPMKDPLEFPPTTILDLSLLWKTDKNEEALRAIGTPEALAAIKEKDEEFFIVEIDNSLIAQRFLVKIMIEVIQTKLPTVKELETSGIYADRVKGMLTAVLSKQRVDQVHKPVVKSAIKSEIRNRINEILGTEKVKDVYFDGFFYQ